jgi:uncharacterized protein involved in outer membrane biogenesis
MLRKWIVRGAAFLIALIIIALVIVYFSLNGIIRSRVQSATADATGQPTTLQSAQLGLFSGTLGLKNLQIHNPQNFGATDFVALQNIDLTMHTGSLLSDTVVLPTITLHGLHISLIQDGLSNNLQEVLAKVQQVRKKNAADGEAGGAGKKLDVGQVRLVDTVLTLSLKNVPGADPQTFEVPIKELVLNHPTNPDGRALRIADLIGQVLAATTDAALKDPRIPAQVRTVLDGLTKLGLPEMLQGLQNGKVSGSDVGNLINGIGGLIDQHKKKPTTTPAQ